MPVAPKVQPEIRQVQSRLMQYLPEVKLVNPKQAHITLSFFPHVSPEKLKKLKEIITLHKAELLKTGFHFRKLGAFPNSKSARVLYLQVEGEIEKLKNTALSIRKLAHGSGLNFDPKNFIPHITVARLKEKSNLENLIGSLNFSPVSFTFGELLLFRTIPTGNRSLYLPVI